MVSILLYSKGRPYFLRRAVAYWSNFHGHVYITDGSIESLEAEFQQATNITYLHRPNETLASRLHELLKLTESKYILLAPDDDFTDFEAIHQAQKYLDKNPEYSAAQGLYIRFGHLDNKPVEWIWDYLYARAYEFNQATAEARLESSLRYPVMHYCYTVARKNAINNSLDLLKDVEDLPPSLFELSFLVAIITSGKYTTLPIFYGARQAHARGWVTHSISDWIGNQSPIGYQKWRQNLQKMLTDETSLPRDMTLQLADKIENLILLNETQKNNNSKTATYNIEKQKKTSLKSLAGPFFIKIYRLLRNTFFTARLLNYQPKQILNFISGWSRIKRLILSHPAAS
jgi:glycosyltransferase domain-containing protein